MKQANHESVKAFAEHLHVERRGDHGRRKVGAAARLARRTMAGARHAVGKTTGSGPMSSKVEVEPMSTMKRWELGSLPEFMHETRMFTTFRRVLWKYHSWVQATVLGEYDPMYPRFVRGMVKSIEVIWLMCAEAVVFILVYQDYGCNKYTNERDCKDQIHPLDPSSSACVWDSEVYEACMEFEPAASDT